MISREELLTKLQLCVDDPMWPDHVEMPKQLIRIVIEQLARQSKIGTPDATQELLEATKGLSFYKDDPERPADKMTGVRMTFGELRRINKARSALISIMRAAGKAAKVMEGWSDSKRKYAARITGVLASPADGGGK